jgi:hypothetical protein
LLNLYADQPFKAVNPVSYLGMTVPRMTGPRGKCVLDDPNILRLRDQFEVALGFRGRRCCSWINFFHDPILPLFHAPHQAQSVNPPNVAVPYLEQGQPFLRASAGVSGT